MTAAPAAARPASEWRGGRPGGNSLSWRAAGTRPLSRPVAGWAGVGSPVQARPLLTHRGAPAGTQAGTECRTAPPPARSTHHRVYVNHACPFCAAPTWAATGAFPRDRYYHSTTVLADGKVLVAGGESGFGTGLGDYATAFVYDPDTEQWTPVGNMTTERTVHTATLLPGGDVLVVGGGRGAVGRSAERFNPASGTWTPVGNLTAARRWHRAVLLPASGKVLVAGSYSPNDFPPGERNTASCELFDPATNTWSPAANMTQRRSDFTLTLLADGRVLAAGGFDYRSFVVRPRQGWQRR